MSIEPRRLAIIFSFITISYNFLEAIIAIYFGIEEESWSLLGFGLDSLIEIGSAFFVLWRLKKSDQLDQDDISRERVGTMGIGILFILLAIITAWGSIERLISKATPDTTLPGLIIALVSILTMFFLWREKKKVALILDSQTVLKDASCTMACFKLSFILFIGSLLFMINPNFFWADSVCALVLAIFIGKEGIETFLAARRPDFSGGCGCD